MRSLTFKLTLAFLIIGLTGAVLVAVIVGMRTRAEFGKFVLDRYQEDLIAQLADFYQGNGSWEGLEAIVVRTPYERPGHRSFTLSPVTLVDMSGMVVYSGREHQMGQQLTNRDLQQAIPVTVDNKTIGRVLFTPEEIQPVAAPPEAAFLTGFNQAILISGLAAAAIALLLSLLLARTISRPVRALTAATQQVAAGKLGHQVEVTSHDELGELARSFNSMSGDLARASQLRRQMTADIAHELRTPLTVLVGYTEALTEGKMTGGAEIYEIMHEETQHLQHLVEDLRTLSLADAGELRLQKRPCSPRRLLERIALAHTALAEEKGITLRVEAEEALPEVEMDPDRMAQVLNNLVGNALRYTPAGGEVRLAAAGGGEQVGNGEEGEARAKGISPLYLTVQDTGAGIAPQDLSHVFERFYRGDEARQTGAGESGLGLAIAKSIVAMHGGTINVESTLGVGTTFTVVLPNAPTRTLA